jgi:hypothetical protein
MLRQWTKPLASPHGHSARRGRGSI